MNLWESFKYVTGFKYIMVPKIQTLSLSQGFEFPGLRRVYLFSQMWQGSKYALKCSYGRFLNIPKSTKFQVSTFASLMKDSECAWIWINNAWLNLIKQVVNMPDQCFTEFWNFFRFWICWSLEYGKVLNMRELHRRQNNPK